MLAEDPSLRSHLGNVCSVAESVGLAAQWAAAPVIAIPVRRAVPRVVFLQSHLVQTTAERPAATVDRWSATLLVPQCRPTDPEIRIRSSPFGGFCIQSGIGTS